MCKYTCITLSLCIGSPAKDGVSRISNHLLNMVDFEITVSKIGKLIAAGFFFFFLAGVTTIHPDYCKLLH